MKPEELKYLESHEWAYITEENGAKVATVGISSFAVEQLNDIVHMELPSVGDTVTAGEEFGEVESVKAVSSMYSPVSGEIIEVQESLPDNLEILSEDPYVKGWIMKVAVSGDDGADKLLDYAAYKAQCDEAQ